MRAAKAHRRRFFEIEWQIPLRLRGIPIVTDTHVRMAVRIAGHTEPTVVKVILERHEIDNWYTVNRAPNPHLAVDQHERHHPQRVGEAEKFEHRRQLAKRCLCQLGAQPCLTGGPFDPPCAGGAPITGAAQPGRILLHHVGQGGDACRQAEMLEARSDLVPSLFADCYRDDGGHCGKTSPGKPKPHDEPWSCGTNPRIRAKSTVVHASCRPHWAPIYPSVTCHGGIDELALVLTSRT